MESSFLACGSHIYNAPNDSFPHDIENAAVGSIPCLVILNNLFPFFFDLLHLISTVRKEEACLYAAMPSPHTKVLTLVRQSMARAQCLPHLMPLWLSREALLFSASHQNSTLLLHPLTTVWAASVLVPQMSVTPVTCILRRYEQVTGPWFFEANWQDVKDQLFQIPEKIQNQNVFGPKHSG